MKVFISYSNKDEGLRKIAADINQCLKNKNFETFFDRDNLNGCPDFDTKITDEISKSEGFIFLISPGSLNTCTDPAGSYALTELELVRKKWNPPGNHVLPVNVNVIGEINCSEEIRSYLQSAGIFSPNGQNVASAVCRKAAERWSQQKNNKPPKSWITVENYPDQQYQNQDDENPYHALKHFGPNHAKYFFGRESFIDELIDKVYQRNFITISGTSGAGKSSVVLAGLVPKLHDELNSNWKFTYFKLLDDKEEPVTALAKALLPFCAGINRADLSIKLRNQQALGEILVEIQCKNKLLIIADQFEEILTYKNSSDSESSEKDRSYFLHTLVEGIEYAAKHTTAATNNRIVLITTIRDSSEGSDSNLFTDHIGRVIDSLGHLDSDEFNSVVNGPLRDLKGEVTDRVLDKLKKVFITDGQINNLPLLQYALWHLWKKRTRNENGDKIDLNSLGEFDGKIETILDTTANEEYDKWPKESREADFKKLFLDLINIKSEKNSTLHTRSKKDLMDSWELAEKLAKSGLIRIYHINDDHKAEIAHEELIHYWKKLEGWVDTAEKDARVRCNLQDKAKKWGEANPKIHTHSIFYSLFREDHLLLRGDELKDASVFEENPISELRDVEKNFLKASRRHSRWVRRRIPVVCLTACLTFMVLISVIYISNISGMRSQLKIDTLNRLSLGEKYFFTQATQEDSNKREGVWHFRKRKEENYTKAISAFEEHVNKHDDPEARIYLNNARFLEKNEEKNLPIIAVSVPIQKNVTISKEILRGVAHAQDDVWECISEPEQCPPDSRKQFPFLVMLASDDNDPEVAERIAEHLVHGELPEAAGGIAQQGYVIAVVGHNASDVTKSVMPIYQNKMVMISPTSTTLSSDDIKVKVNQKKDNFTYLISYPNKDLAPNLVNLSKFEKEKELLYCHDEKVDKAKLEEGFKGVIDSAGTECVFKHNEAERVFKDISKKVTHILLAPHASTITDSIFIARENNKEKKLQLLGTATLYSKEVLEAKEEGFFGMTLAIGWHQEWEPEDKEISKEISEKIRNFAKAANRKWHYKQGSEESLMNITWRTAAAYDAAKLISTSLNKTLDSQAKDANFEDKISLRSKLQHEIFKSLPFTGVTGKIKFDDYGIRQAEGGKLPSILMRITKNDTTKNHTFELLKNN